MLVTVHLWTHNTLDAPLLHLQRQGPNGLFDRFAEHYEALWRDTSLPIEPGDEPDPAIDDKPEPREPAGDAESGADHEPAINPQRTSAPPPVTDSSLDPPPPRRWARRPPQDFTAQ